MHYVFLQGIHKLSIGVRRYPQFQALFHTLVNIFQNNHTGSRQMLLLRTVTETWQVSKLIIGSTIVGILLYGLWPVYQLLWNGEKELFLNVVIPGVDYTSGWGYATTSVILISFAFWGITGNLAYDLYLQILVCSHRSMVALLGDSMDQLGQLARQSDCDAAYRKAFLRNILIAFQDAEKYVAPQVGQGIQLYV